MIKVCSTYSSTQLMISHCEKSIFKSQHFNFASILQFIILKHVSLKKSSISKTIYSVLLFGLKLWNMLPFTAQHSEIKALNIIKCTKMHL